MAAFKVGQRVRVLFCKPGSAAVRIHNRSAAGHEATITHIPARGNNKADCEVLIDNFPLEPNYGSWAAKFYQLSPILPEEDLVEEKEEALS